MFVVFYSVNLNILCICDLLHIVLSLWHTYGSMECVCVYIYIYICMAKTYPASMEKKRQSLCSQKPQQWTLPNKLNQLPFHIISVKASLKYSNHV